MVKQLFCNSFDPVDRGCSTPRAKNTKRQNSGATESGRGTRRLVSAARCTTRPADDQDQGHNPGKKTRSLGAVAPIFPAGPKVNLDKPVPHQQGAGDMVADFRRVY